MLRFRQRWRNALEARRAVSATLTARHSLRLHSLVLFFWTIFAGTLVSHLLHGLGMASLSERYVLACAASYGAFLFGVRVWLWHVDALPDEQESAVDAADLPNLIEMGIDGAELAGEAIGDAGEASAAVVGEGGVAALALIVLALAATVIILLTGPELLIDVAFEAVLAGSLIGTIRLGYEPDWFLRVLARTWWIFLLAAILMAGFGRYAHRHYPEAATLAEILTAMRPHGK